MSKCVYNSLKDILQETSGQSLALSAYESFRRLSKMALQLSGGLPEISEAIKELYDPKNSVKFSDFLRC